MDFVPSQTLNRLFRGAAPLIPLSLGVRSVTLILTLSLSSALSRSLLFSYFAMRRRTVFKSCKVVLILHRLICSQTI